MEITSPNDQLRLVRSLFPNFAETLDAAHTEHGLAEAIPDQSGAGFDAWLDDEARQLREGALAGAPFATLPAAESSRFERAFAAARLVAQRSHLTLPEPEAFVEAGANLLALASKLAADPALVPVIAPYGLGPERWRELFRAAAEQQGSPLSGGEPLLLAAEAVDGFAILDSIPDVTSSRVEIALPEGGSVTWTLRLIPSSPKPPLLGLGFAHGPHVSLPEILMLQLMRIASGERPVDTESFTWLAGSLADGRLAARHVFDESEAVIRISCREIGNQGPHLGARPPVS
ncbi:hypothetical protein G7068_01720 [Leucobacter viscericola]|uniref:Uncharacterized protein n=2 Tax=Leucobacter viscericola TaxID=2714935 RepID=A0A6G7XJI0_9MICO|nr:hypothetical protein G7068_01720 [Leucobacter viscericola]